MNLVVVAFLALMLAVAWGVACRSFKDTIGRILFFLLEAVLIGAFLWTYYGD